MPHIAGNNIDGVAEMISRTRLDDLRKEYDKILPGLPSYIAAFHGQNSLLTADAAYQLLKAVLERGSDDSLVQQDFYILADPWDVLRALYSIGLVGVREPIAGTFV